MIRIWISILVLLMGVDLSAQVVRNSGWMRRPIRNPSPEPLEWGLEAAAHLMRRAGFSASPEELNQIVQQGLEATLDQLIDFEQVDDSAMELSLAALNYPFVRTNQNDQLRINYDVTQRWWLYRMLHTRHQLVEKMTFVWHDHFATSAFTINQVDGNGEALMIVQNRTLREYALGNFKEMVRAISRDLAMIIWLNNNTNVVGNPNENWARELLELFTMGEGNGYTEFDIQEAARAFTGWTLVPLRRSDFGTPLTFLFVPGLHDTGPKVFLGNTIPGAAGEAGLSDAEQVIDIVFQQPEVAEFIVSKLWNTFVYPDPQADLLAPLADLFRESGYQLKPLMRALFSHPHFMSEKSLRAKIKSPIEFTIGAFRELLVAVPDNLPRVTAYFGLGQNLFQPPDVGGWTEDEGWINTGTALSRSNFMTFLTSNRKGEPIGGLGGADRVISRFDDQIPVEEILEDNNLQSAEQVVDFFLRALVQEAASLDTRYSLEQYLQTGALGEPRVFDVTDPVQVDEKVRGLIYLISLLPAYQLK